MVRYRFSGMGGFMVQERVNSVILYLITAVITCRSLINVSTI